MWITVDRIEGEFVILIDEQEQIYTLPKEVYVSITGIAPQESQVLSCHVQNGNIQQAVYSPEETQHRLARAKARLERLKQRAKKK